jgi:hypothetical protein
MLQELIKFNNSSNGLIDEILGLDINKIDLRRYGDRQELIEALNNNSDKLDINSLKTEMMTAAEEKFNNTRQSTIESLKNSNQTKRDSLRDAFLGSD